MPLAKPIIFLAIATGPAVALGDGNWPSFRGPNGSGVGTESPPVRWDLKTGENLRWKRRIPGLGHSSPIVWSDRVFITTAESTKTATPELKTGWLKGSGDPALETEPWSWKVFCLDKNTGRILWDKEACAGVPKVNRHPKSSHANSTPATDGKRVVAFFGSEGLYSYDFEGHLLWKKDLGVLKSGPHNAPNLHWGFASSPVIHGGKVIVQCDALNAAFWASLDVETGQELRRVPRDEVATWSTPAIVEAGGRAQVVLNGWKHMGGYDLETGKELWRIRGGGDIPVPTPQIAGETIILTNGHGRSPIYAVRADARGDLTPSQSSGDLPAGLLWWQPRHGSYMPTPLVLGENLFVASDNGILSVFDVQSGKERYRQRLEAAATFSASVVAAAGRLYFVSEEGEVFVLKAGNSFELQARNSMGEICFATPAISNGLLLVRGRDHLYCLGPATE